MLLRRMKPLFAPPAKSRRLEGGCNERLHPSPRFHGSAICPRAVEATPRRRLAEAETAIAVIDGLLLMRQLGGAAVADRAARRLEVR